MREKNKAGLEIGMNIIFGCIVLGMYLVSHDYDFIEGTILGARTFPLLVGGILAMFAFLNILSVIRRLRFTQITTVAEPPEESEIEVGNNFNILLRKNRVLAAVFLLVIYYLMLVFAGFLIATILLIPAMLYLLEYRKFKSVMVITVLGTTLLFTAFQVLLGVPLPDGLLFG